MGRVVGSSRWERKVPGEGSAVVAEVVLVVEVTVVKVVVMMVL